MRITGIILFLFLCIVQVKAQDTRGNDQMAPQMPMYQATKKQSFFKRLFGNKGFQSRQFLPYEEQEAFEKRMKAVARQKKKEARLASKPQAANVEYFGHKKPPKKRPVGKKKFCKECGIKH